MKGNTIRRIHLFTKEVVRLIKCKNKKKAEGKKMIELPDGTFM